MKKVIPLFILMFTLASCSVEAVPDEFNHQGKWELVHTRGNFAESEKTGDELTFRETYNFKRNGKVVKTRTEHGASQASVSGTYKLIIPADTEGPEGLLLNLVLQFPSKDPLVANCMDNSVEYLLLTTDHVLLNSWYACDGLYMEYHKTD